MELEIKLTYMPGAPVGPEDLLARLAVLPEVPGYRFSPPRPRVLRDVYFDTGNHRLQAARVGLRLRLRDGQALITVKRGQRREGALAQRGEYEALLTAAHLEEALAPLRAEGLLPAEQEVPLAPFSRGEPAGPLVPTLVTETRRADRLIYRMPGHLPVGTLSLDRVTYVSVRGTPVYHDVEIEARGLDNEGDLRRLQGLLVEAAGGYLKESHESKLARGLRLAAGGRA